MSLINPKDGWIRFDGTSVQGITPPQVRLRSGTLTPERLAAVSDLYSKFTTAKRLSLAGSGFFTADRKLPDGTIVRMVAINDIDHVHIWAADPVPEEVEGVTFWCIPWDDAWIDEEFTEVFTIPRWLEIGTADGEVEAADFLQDLIRNEKYEPPNAGLYPGNQAWFAPPPHPLAGIVVSWWGPSKRYANSERDIVVGAAGTWGRTTWPLYETVSFTSTPEAGLAAMMAAPTGGVGAAVAEHMFDMLDATELPVGVDAVGRPNLSSQSVWINGLRYIVDVGQQINSACLQRRGEDVFLRVITIAVVGIAGTSARVYEKRISEGAPGAPEPAWALVGFASLIPENVGLGPPLSDWSNFTTLALGWDDTYVHLTQPFLWDADGSKAVSVIHYVTGDTTSPGTGAPLPREKYGTHAVIEITANSGGVIAALIDQTSETASWTSSVVAEPKPTAPPNNVYAYSPLTTTTTEALSEYSAPVAADYLPSVAGPAILRTHVSMQGNSEEVATNTNAVYTWTSGDPPHSAYFSPSGDASGTHSVVYESWVTFADDEVAGTRTARTITTDTSVHADRDVNENYPGGPYSYGENYTSSTYTLSGSGSVGLWGLSSGDLRGGVVLLHNTPISRLPGAPAVCVDAQSNYSALNTSNRIIAGPVDADITATVADNPGAGLLCTADLKNLSSESVGNFVAPTLRHNVGTLTASQVGGSISITRSGPYGAGPWVGLDDYADLPLMNAGLGFLSMCPIHWTTLVSGSSGTSRLTVNAPRTPLNIGGEYFSGSHDVVGGYGNTTLSASAVTPDTKIQYVGAVFVAMTPPTDKDAPECFHVDKWFHEGNEFTPLYPPQPDPENPGSTVPFPHRGGHSVLLDPIFTGPLP